MNPDELLRIYPLIAFAPAIALVVAIVLHRFIPPVYRWFLVQWGRVE